VNFEAFYPYVLPSARQAPPPTLDFHIRQAAIQFCERTHLWVETLDSILADGYSKQYALPIDELFQVVKLLVVTINDIDYWLDEGVRARRAGRYSTCNAESVYMTPDCRDVVFVEQVPALNDKLGFEAVLKPSEAAYELPDLLFQQHARAIGYGALASLLLIADTDWFNPKLAGENLALFEGRISVAGLNASRGNARTRKRVRGHFF
jgi:hypothetical protein